MDLFNGKEFVSGELIKVLRTYKGFKQSAAAKKVDVCQQYISKLESRKKIPVAKFMEIAFALNCSNEDVRKIIELLSPPPRMRFSFFLTANSLTIYLCGKDQVFFSGYKSETPILVLFTRLLSI